MERIDIWLARGGGVCPNSGGDLDQAGGPILAFCSTYAGASRVAQGRGGYGNNGVVQKAAGLRIDGEVWLLARTEPIDLDRALPQGDVEVRAAALAKLTPTERRALGLSE